MRPTSPVSMTWFWTRRMLLKFRRLMMPPTLWVMLAGAVCEWRVVRERLGGGQVRDETTSNCFSIGGFGACAG